MKKRNLLLLARLWFLVLLFVSTAAIAGQVNSEVLYSSATQMARGHGPKASYQLEQNSQSVADRAVNLRQITLKESGWSSIDGDTKAPPKVEWFTVTKSSASEIPNTADKTSYTPVEADIGKQIRVIVRSTSEASSAGYVPTPNMGAPTEITTGIVYNAGLQSVVANKKEVISDGKDQVSFTAHVMSGNTPLAGAVVKFSSSNITGVKFEPADMQATTDGKGDAVLKAKSVDDGTLTISAFAQDNPNVTKNASATFRWYEVGSLTPSKATDVIANDQDSSMLTAKVLGLNNLTAPPNISVTFTKPSNSGVHFKGQSSDTNVVTVMTNSQGLSTVDVQSIKAASFSFVAKTADKGQVQKFADVGFVADASTGEPTIVNNSNDALANNVATNVVKVAVKDANKNLVSNVGIVVDNLPSGVSLVNTKPTTGADGSVLLSFKSTKAGAFSEIGVTVSGSKSTNKRALIPVMRFIADKSTAKVTELTAIKDNAALDGVAPNTIQVAVADANGNALSGYTVTFTHTASGAKQQTAVTNAQGLAQVSFVLNPPNPQTGQNLTDTVSTTLTPAVTKVLTFRYVKIGVPQAVRQGAVADGVATDTFKVCTTYLDGSAAANVRVKFDGAFGTQANNEKGPRINGTLLTATYTGPLDNTGKVLATTGGDGCVTLPVTSLTPSDQWDEVSWTYNNWIGVTINNSVRQGEPDNFVVLKFIANPSVQSVTVDRSNTLSDGKQQATFGAKVVDGNGAPIKGLDVDFTATGPADTFIPISKTATSDAQGIATLVVASEADGDETITAATKLSPTITQSNKTTFKWYGLRALTANKTAGVVANDKDSSTLSAEVMEPDGKTAAPAGISVTFSKPSDPEVHFEG